MSFPILLSLTQADGSLPNLCQYQQHMSQHYYRNVERPGSPPLPYFWTKLRPEGPPPLSRGLDDRPRPLI